jgi:hypothetical protein
MFDVVICTVNTGRVQHKAFDTHEEARQYADSWLEKQLNNKRRKIRPSAREFRIVINRIDVPTVRTVEGQPNAAA